MGMIDRSRVENERLFFNFGHVKNGLFKNPCWCRNINPDAVECDNCSGDTKMFVSWVGNLNGIVQLKRKVRRRRGEFGRSTNYCIFGE